MLLDSEKMIEGYFDKVKEDYPGISYQEFSTICRNPFAYLKLMMKQVHMPKIRFQYFGVFLVYRKRVEASRHEEYNEKGTINPKRYERIKKSVEYKLNQVV